MQQPIKTGIIGQGRSGWGIHAEELREAQAHPEKYENLQIRVAGWNVRWNDLSRAEQDAYIRRAETIGKQGVLA